MSIAGKWAQANRERPQEFRLGSVDLWVTTEGKLGIRVTPADLDATPERALDAARWLIHTFGNPEEWVPVSCPEQRDGQPCHHMSGPRGPHRYSSRPLSFLDGDTDEETP